MQEQGYRSGEGTETPASPPTPCPAGTSCSSRFLLFGVAMLLLGIGTIFIAAIMDMAAVGDKPWNNAILLFNPPDTLPEGQAYSVKVRTVERTEVPEDSRALQILEMLLRWEEKQLPAPLVSAEYLVAMDVSPDILAPLLLSGRLPEPGKPEVLAGDLARDIPFEIDGVKFSIVGHLQPTVSGFLFAYLLPHRQDFPELFTESKDPLSGILMVDGLSLLEAGILPKNALERLSRSNEESEESGSERSTGTARPKKAPRHPPYLGGMIRVPDRVARLTAWGLCCIAIGSAVLHACFFRWLSARRLPGIGVLLHEMTRRPVLFWGMHVLLYGTFFYSLYSTMNAPLTTYRVGQYVEYVFSDGGLDYVGAAYASKSIWRATAATFVNNYVVQTLLYTFAVSLIGIPLGLLKCLLSFVLVGGAMAPLWAGVAQGYVIHAFTMALELEAYVIACFAIVAWTIYAARILFARDPWLSLKTGLAVFFGAVVLTALMLANAAMYEAVTLILLL